MGGVLGSGVQGGRELTLVAELFKKHNMYSFTVSRGQILMKSSRSRIFLEVLWTSASKHTGIFLTATALRKFWQAISNTLR